MANGTRKSAGLMAALVLSGAPAAAAEPPAPIPVAVRVYNYTAAPAGDVAKAQAEAARVYADIGIAIHWQDRGPSAVALVLLPRNMTEKKAAAEGIPSDVLGRATAVTGRAYAFYDRVIEVAVRKRVDPWALLGKVIAHELGHVLLAEPGHAREGIMRADLETRANPERFTSAQAASIRLRLAVPEQSAGCEER